MSLFLSSLSGPHSLVLGSTVYTYPWEVDTIVYVIPSHLFVTKQQSCLHSYVIVFGYTYILTSFPSALLEYLDQFKLFVG